jgi:maleamate amidohydrolase
MADRNVALLLVDVLEAFFTPGRPAYYPDSATVLGPLRELLTTARQRDRVVVHAVERHRPGLVDFEHHKLPVHCEIGDDQSPYVEGFEPVDRTGTVFDGSLRNLREVEIPKRRYSAFYATDLDLLLREQGVRTLVIGGVKTNVCVRATVQDAFAAGYEILLAKEATNSNRPHLAEASLEDIDRYFGSVVSVEEALERL